MDFMCCTFVTEVLNECVWTFYGVPLQTCQIAFLMCLRRRCEMQGGRGGGGGVGEGGGGRGGGSYVLGPVCRCVNGLWVTCAESFAGCEMGVGM